jgi:glucokinase
MYPTLNLEAFLIGAVDIGGTKIAVAAISEHGEIAAQDEWRTGSLSPEAAVSRMAESLARYGKSAGAALRGIGIGCTGPVDTITGTVGDVDLLPGWSGFPLVQRLADETRLSVAMENDADAAALAESQWGAGKGASRFIYVTISTGIGTGMVFDRELYRGANGSHPEAGHHAIDPSGPLCYCGARGCWESLASGPAMVRWMTSNAGHQNYADGLTARDVCNLAREGDPLAVSAMERQAEYLGIGLANLITMFCPDAIALGGGVMRSADMFLERAKHIARTRCALVPPDQVTITRATLGVNAALLGAARVWQARFGDRNET